MKKILIINLLSISIYLNLFAQTKYPPMIDLDNGKAVASNTPKLD
jgi:hypothetical protein